MRRQWRQVLVLGTRGLVRLGGEGKQKKGKTKADYVSNMLALASALVSTLDTAISFEQSKPSGPQEDLMCQIIDIVSELLDLSKQHIVNTFEFFRVNPNAQSIFLRMKEHFRSNYIRSVIP